MSWGHATSTNLITWTEQPVAIACDENEDIYSGSVVYDQHNTSGLSDGTAAPLVAIYTSAYKEKSQHAGIQAQSLAWSTDGGCTWSKYHGNPVLSRDSAEFRDPKWRTELWHADHRRDHRRDRQPDESGTRTGHRTAG